jgi:hypothetical protein
MALKQLDLNHAAQIQAGTVGRNRGHDFEFQLADKINKINYPILSSKLNGNIFRGDPAATLISFVTFYVGWKQCEHAEAIALGALATAEEGKRWLEINGVRVKACKSDILLNLHDIKGLTKTIGISVKQCNNRTPTNAQLYFTTAYAFCELLRNNRISISADGEKSLRQFCGDNGYRPQDDPSILSKRNTDPRRFFWEETSRKGRLELEIIFSDYQDKITRLLLQKAYLNDPFTPEILLHKTKKVSENPQEYALYSIEELIILSRKYKGFEKKEYSVRKGQYRDPVGVSHEAPRFGIVQMQRGGQKQHPTQLQFNLEAGYFYKI